MYRDSTHLTPPPLQLATYQDHQRGLKMTFHYQGSGRLPRAVTIQTAQGQAVYRLGFDQAGSLKAVASQDPDGALRVVKVVDYDSFGNILSDSNPNLFLPLGFAGGLRDRFTGLVRFCHRDYDPTVGRFTAPDPLGDTGGDHDLYDYCVDEPVGKIDPEGLQEGAVAEEGGFFDGLKNMFGKLGDKVGSFLTGSKDQPETAGPAATANQAEGAGQAGESGKAEGASQDGPGQQGSSDSGGRAPGADDPDDTVHVGSRKAELRWPLNQFDHKWLKTEKYESGMGQAAKDGQAGGNVPGVDGRSDAPYAPTETVDHSGESQRKGTPVRYEKVTGMNVDCVNARIKPGRETGPWVPGLNDCHGFVGSILHDCKKGSFEEDFPYEPGIKPRSRK